MFGPLTKKYEERGVRQRVRCIQVGSQPVTRRTESVVQTTECSVDVLEGFAPVDLHLKNPYKAATMSLLGLGPELQILAKCGKRGSQRNQGHQSRWQGQFNSGHHLGTHSRRKLRS